MPTLKGAFIKLESGRPSPVADVIVFQFNPDTVTRTPTLVSAPASPVGGGEMDANDQPAEPSESISFSLRVDATDALAEGSSTARSYGVLPALSALELLLQPQPAQSANLSGGGAGPHRHPPDELATTLFFWGEQRILPVTVSSLSISELEYDTALNPIRAEVYVNLDVLTPSQLSSRDRLARGAYAYTQRVKGTLAGVNRENPPNPLTRTLDRVRRT